MEDGNLAARAPERILTLPPLRIWQNVCSSAFTRSGVEMHRNRLKAELQTGGRRQDAPRRPSHYQGLTHSE